VTSRPLTVVSLNVNGLRSAIGKGLWTWLLETQPDICCLQEVRTPLALLAQEVFHPPGYRCYYVEAEKKGYSGVGILSRLPVDGVFTVCGLPCADREGRYIEATIAGLSVLSLYMPSGTSGPERQEVKYAFMDDFYAWLQQRAPRPTIICGDWNIAHRPIDLAHWRANQNSSGFLLPERAWFDRLLGQRTVEYSDPSRLLPDPLGWVDAFRVVNTQSEQYTWWSARSPTAWARNVGWRIDYQIITPDLTQTVLNACVYRGHRFSDHAPVCVGYSC
jgi:exodeoxyribonuclease-3